MTEMKTEMNQQVKVGEFLVELATGEHDGEPFVALRGINCNLEGEMPGLYYLTALKPEEVA